MALSTTPFAASGAAKTASTRARTGGGGAEGDVEGNALPALAGAADALSELDAGAGELVAVSALERVDALLRVADGEEGAVEGFVGRFVLGAGAEAGEELVGETVGDVPLLGGGVLDFVEQEMIDAAVELVEDPGGAGFLEEGLGAGDEVAVVELVELALAVGVGLEGGAGEAQEGDSCFGAADGGAAGFDGEHAGLFGGEGFEQAGMFGGKRLAGEAVEGARLALLGGPAAEPLGPFAFALVGFGEPGDHVFDFALGGFAAADLDGPKGIAERGLLRPSDGFSHQGGFAGGGGTGGA